MMGGDGPTVLHLRDYAQVRGPRWIASMDCHDRGGGISAAKLHQECGEIILVLSPGYAALPEPLTFGPLNTRSLTNVRRRARELTPPSQKVKFLAEKKPNNKDHKLYRQFSKPPGQAPGKYSRDYLRATSVEGEDRRYAGLKVPVGDSLFAAYDPSDIKAAKYLIVATSDYLYTHRSFFWPDVIFLTAPNLDRGQSAGMTISVRRAISMDPQVIVIAGSNDYLQSTGLLSRLTDGSISSNEIIGEAIMTEVEASVQRNFTKNVVRSSSCYYRGRPHCLNPYSLCTRWSQLCGRDDSA